MLTYTQRIPNSSDITVNFMLALTADERVRSRHYFETEGQAVYLHLPRGSVLHHGDLLRSPEHNSVIQVVAKPEPVLTVTATTSLLLLKAAYHLGNRHVALEITETYLRLSPDPVLRSMLNQMGLQVMEEIAPFQPETGAYGHSHGAASEDDGHSGHGHSGHEYSGDDEFTPQKPTSGEHRHGA
ncbi:MAG: urease accessory protein UreE [Oculatellaceae cyanobacterium bins.114]|nr:urease accessory protein UreE [Oculatellaceae cyanobacterium bins.114]